MLAMPSQFGAQSRGRVQNLYPRPPAVAQFKQEFERFHSENGVRTVLGTIGPVNDGTPILLHSRFCRSVV